MRKTQIVVPIMPTSLADWEHYRLSDYALANVIEWRADYLPYEEILEVAPKIFEKFQDFKILLTIRTAREGGKLEVSEKKYIDILNKLLTFNPDFIDLEYFSYPKALKAFSEIKDKIVLSYHNFKVMPDDLTQRLLKMHREKTAFVKAAIMPQRECDILDLLQITRDMTLEYGRHFITIAMGDLGKISRVANYLTGSCWTFAAVGAESAPGQISLQNMDKMLKLFEDENEMFGFDE